MNTKTKKIVFSALFAALIFVATTFLQIPQPSGMGFIHLGDSFILMACYYLGGWYAVAATVVGSCLADVVLFPSYAIVTLVVKGLMSVVVCLLLKKANRRVFLLLAFLAGEVVMLLGYFAYEAFAFGAVLAFANTVSGLLQAVAGLVVAFVVASLVDKKLVSKKGNNF